MIVIATARNLIALLAAAVSFGAMLPTKAASDCAAPPAVCATRDAVFTVAAYYPIGSAVRLGDDLLVTNRHIVADLERVSILTKDGDAIDALVIPNAGTSDLVLLRVPGLPTGSVLTPSADAAEGPVFVVGADVGTQEIRAFAPGNILSLPAVGYPRARLHHDAHSQPGTSGGALVNASGDFLGIVASGGEGRHDAVPTAAIAALIDHSGSTHKTVHDRLGRAYRRCGDLLDVHDGRYLALSDENASAIVATCIASGNRQLLTVAGRVLGESRRLDESIALFEAALALDPNAVNARLSLVVALHFAGRYAEELPHLDSLMADMPSDPQVLRFAIQAAKWSGNPAIAEAAYGILAEHHPQLAPPARRFLDSDAPPPRRSQ